MALASRMFARVSLVVWVIAAVAIGVTLQARHLLALPKAEIGQIARDTSAALLRDGGRELAVWHVLAADCACSRRVVAHLAERPVLPGTIETILWVTKGSEGPPPQTGAMHVQTVTPNELQRRFGAVAAPQLIAIDRAGSVRYVGGYARRKQGQLEDAAIIAALTAGSNRAPLPVYGCAVSEELARAADPFGVEAMATRGQ